jgi:hypothetical protein
MVWQLWQAENFAFHLRTTSNTYPIYFARISNFRYGRRYCSVMKLIYIYMYTLVASGA